MTDIRQIAERYAKYSESHKAHAEDIRALAAHVLRSTEPLGDERTADVIAGQLAIRSHKAIAQALGLSTENETNTLRVVQEIRRLQAELKTAQDEAQENWQSVMRLRSEREYVNAQISAFMQTGNQQLAELRDENADLRAQIAAAQQREKEALERAERAEQSVADAQRIMAEFKHIYPDGFPEIITAQPQHLASQITAVCNSNRATFQLFCELINVRDSLKARISELEQSAEARGRALRHIADSEMMGISYARRIARLALAPYGSEITAMLATPAATPAPKNSDGTLKPENGKRPGDSGAMFDGPASAPRNDGHATVATTGDICGDYQPEISGGSVRPFEAAHQSGSALASSPTAVPSENTLAATPSAEQGDTVRLNKMEAWILKGHADGEKKTVFEGIGESSLRDVIDGIELDAARSVEAKPE